MDVELDGKMVERLYEKVINGIECRIWIRDLYHTASPLTPTLTQKLP